MTTTNSTSTSINARTRKAHRTNPTCERLCRVVDDSIHGGEFVGASDADVISAYLNDRQLPRCTRSFRDARRAFKQELAEQAAADADIRFNGKRWESYVLGEFVAAGPTPASVREPHNRAVDAALAAAFSAL